MNFVDTTEGARPPMKVIFSFDHELFFGERSGSPEKCMIEPGKALAAVAGKHDARLCFFVDAGYLDALARMVKGNGTLGSQERMFRSSLDELAGQGHELLLHVHPHWEDTVWRDGEWRFNLARFALSRFDDDGVLDIFRRQADALRLHTLDGSIHAYRAGGWAVQPFAPIGKALEAVGIFIDSSVYAGGKDSSGGAAFDFTYAPKRSVWRFQGDPAREVPEGTFLEVATSGMTVSPAYYWRLALARSGRSVGRDQYGDGVVRPVSAMSSLLDKIGKLLAPSHYCVTLDGMKAELALGEYRRARLRGQEYLVLLSHPKMLTRSSIECLDALLCLIRQNGDEVVGYGGFAALARHAH
jgi:hypothetical protein